MLITKTRWTIEPQRIVIRPFGLFFILGGVFAIIFITIFFAFKGIGQQNPIGSAPVALFLLFTLVVFLLGGFTYILFDRSSGKMQKMLFGFIPVKTIPFDQLYGVNTVTHSNGGFNYRIFTRTDKFGKGTVISCGYSKNTDANALAFNNEVVPLIHQFLDAVAPLPQEKSVYITDYTYFTEADGIYTFKASKVGGLILGVPLLLLGIHECTPAAWLTNVTTFGKLAVCIFPIAMGVIFIAAAFTTISFNTRTRMVARKSPIGINNQQHPFEHYLNFQSVRKTYNGIYTGTDVIMYFQKPGDSKAKGLLLASFRNTRKIERLMQEVTAIMR